MAIVTDNEHIHTYMILIYNDDSDDDCYDSSDCDDELLCHRIRKTMMMMMYG